MRRLFLIAALFLWTPAGAQNDDATPRKIEKETFVYAVRDADTLRLDRYALLSPDSRAKPCLMFLFGGGFMTGTRDNRRFRPFFDYYARKGFVVVSIDYRLGMKRARQAGLLDEEQTRSHTDGFRRNNANYWNKREICRFYLYSSIIWFCPVLEELGK